MSGCFGCGGLQPEIKLLNDCYPPSKALLTAGPDFKPLSSDLSKLTYRCTNQSSKLAKVGEELEKRVQREATRSTGGYAKSRASLLISLAILRALINECRRDLALFSRSIVRIVNNALEVKVYQKGKLDLEVIGRAASCFIAYTTYAEGSNMGTDDTVANTYLTVLRKFAVLATTRSTTADEEPDTEFQNRTRLIGLAALNGVTSSDAIFSSMTDSKKQVELIIPALLLNIFEGAMESLKLEAAKIEIDAAPSPFFSEFSTTRPAARERRAPSLYAHIPGEKGPSDVDVLSAALRSLHSLVRQCNVNTATQVLEAIFGFFDRVGWNDVERCCWLAERLTAFVTLQYRFVIPTRLVELLFDLDDKTPTRKQTTVLAMVTVILNSPISLVGLGVTDLLNNLVGLIVRRVRINVADSLLPPLVQCIASLGTHIYYADQINDIIEEIALRMAELPMEDKARPEILRVLIYAMIGVLNTAISADAAEARVTAHRESISADKGKGPAVDTPLEVRARTVSRRNPVSPVVWQETLPLLCESAYAVRAAYARALILYLVNEIPREKKPGSEDPTVRRFCNAVNAAIYTLAMSSCLGTGSPATVSSSSEAGAAAERKEVLADMPEIKKVDSPENIQKNEVKTGEKGVSFNITEPTPTGTPGDTTNGASTPTRKRRGSRRVSLPLNRLNSSLVLSSFEDVATPFDFAQIIVILDALHTAVPYAALITGVPMLLALDKDAGSDLVRQPGDGRQGSWVLERKRSIREVLAIVWKQLGTKWGSQDLIDYASKMLNSLPEPFEVPNPPPAPEGILPAPEEAVQFYPHTTEGESSSATQPLLDPQVLLATLVDIPSVNNVNSDRPALSSRLGAPWTVEIALQNAVERFSSATVRPTDDTHFDVANVLMSMNNPSYQSFGRPHSKAVDVTDLREALGTGSTLLNSNTNANASSPPSIISTAPGRSFREREEGSPRRRQQPLNDVDAQEVLRDIFKNAKAKKKHHREVVPNGSVNGEKREVINGMDGMNGTSEENEPKGVNGAREPNGITEAEVKVA